jgi:hypothetical protein
LASNNRPELGVHSITSSAAGEELRRYGQAERALLTGWERELAALVGQSYINADGGGNRKPRHGDLKVAGLDALGINETNTPDAAIRH